MIGGDYDFEPVRGLPANLPRGEALLWQGGPDFKATALRVFHMRKVAIYFAILAAWRLVSTLLEGAPLTSALSGASILVGLGLLVSAILCVITWLVCRSTVYTVTSRRIVMRIGVALPIHFNLPFKVIDSASLKLNPDGTGTIPLVLSGSNRLAYLVLWPHARPWRLGKPEPALRMVPGAAKVAQILAQAVSAAAPGKVQAGQPVVAAARGDDAATWPMAPAAV